MQAFIKSFYESITQIVGSNFSVYDGDGKLIIGENSCSHTIKTNFSDYHADEQLNRTVFKFKLKNVELIGSILGCSKSERAILGLIREIASKFFIKPAEFSREDFLRSLVLGEVIEPEANKFLRKFSISSGSCCALIILIPSRLEEVVDVVSNYSANGKDFLVQIDSESIVLVKFSDEDTNEYRSITEYAKYLVNTVFEETGVWTCVYTGGIVKSASLISASYQQAKTALRMSNEDTENLRVRSFKEFMLVKILEDIPKYRLNEYLELLNDPGVSEVFADEEMMATAKVFFLNNLNQSETARQLYLHRNTLSYRLDKIERITGLDIRKFSDAVSFRLITFLNYLVN